MFDEYKKGNLTSTDFSNFSKNVGTSSIQTTKPSSFLKKGGIAAGVVGGAAIIFGGLAASGTLGLSEDSTAESKLLNQLKAIRIQIFEIKKNLASIWNKLELCSF